MDRMRGTAVLALAAALLAGCGGGGSLAEQGKAFGSDNKDSPMSVCLVEAKKRFDSEQDVNSFIGACTKAVEALGASTTGRNV